MAEWQQLQKLQLRSVLQSVESDGSRGRRLTVDYDRNSGAAVYSPTVSNGVYGLPITSFTATPDVLEQYVWNSANRLQKQINPQGNVMQYAYDDDNNRVKMTIDVERGPDTDHGPGNGQGNGNGNGKRNGNGNGNGNGAEPK